MKYQVFPVTVVTILTEFINIYTVINNQASVQLGSQTMLGTKTIK